MPRAVMPTHSPQAAETRAATRRRDRKAELAAQLAAMERELLAGLTRRTAVLEQPAPPSPGCGEKAFQKTLVDYAHLLGWVVWHDNDSRWNDAGLPDLLLIRGDRCVFAELKSARGRLEPEQCVWAVLLTRCAAVEWFLWRPYPEDWAEIERVLA